MIASCGLLPNPSERVYLPSGSIREIKSNDSSVLLLEYRVNPNVSTIDGIVPISVLQHPVQDIAIISNTDSRIEILKNLGDGRIVHFSNLDTCSGGGDLDTSDFDGNGYDDLILTCSNEPLIQIFYGNGKGDFTLKSVTFTPSIVSVSTPSSYGQPGTNMFALLKDNPATLEIYYRGRSGDFTLRKTLPTPAAPSSMVNGVFTPDGKESYIVVSQNNSQFSTYINNGTNYDRFDTNTISSPSEFDLVDFRGNGYNDLIVASSTENIFRIYENNGAGRFLNFIEYSIPGGTGALIGEAHLRAVSKSELVFQNSTNGIIYIYPHTGLNHFEKPINITAGSQYANITTAALNHTQGDLDLIMNDSVNNQLVLWLNQKNAQ